MIKKAVGYESSKVWVRIILALGTNHLNFGYESSGYETSGFPSIPLYEVKKRRFVGSQELHQQSLNSLYSCAKSVKILHSVPRKLILLKF